MPENLTKVISKESVLQALEQIIQANSRLIPSTRFDIVYKGQRFPPKDVVRKAAQIQGVTNGETYRLSDGESTNRHLRAKGFEIISKEDTIKYFIGGAAWSETGDQAERFIRNGVWENGYKDRFLDEVNAIPESSRFAIKSTYAKDSESILRIKAIGTVTHNHRDGRELDITWDADVSTFDLPGLGGYRTTIHEITLEPHIEAIFYHEEFEDDEAFLLNSTPMQHPLNTILYGPPGTGKTYHTVNKAVAITNPGFDLEGASRRAVKDEYNRLVVDGQIQFVTFHQSMSYEDFIEGIKPVEPKEGETFLKYRVEDGIFKRMVEQAAYVPNLQEASVYLSEEEFAKAAFYSLTLATATQPGDKAIYRYCLEKGCIALNVAEGYNATGKTEAEIKGGARAYPQGEGAALAKLVHHVKTGNYVLLCDGESTCRAIGRVTSDYEYRPNDEITPDHFRSVEWLVTDVQIPREQLYASAYTYGLERLDRSEVKKDFFTKKTVAIQPALVRKNYVLIIDEINRGNVSLIFGELITLIEEDKRKGKNRDEALTVTLPYSKKPFSVPDNLYIIGTMNTADRSVEALDTALRRRFVFEEMLPRPELLNSYQRVKYLWVKYKHINSNDQNGLMRKACFANFMV